MNRDPLGERSEYLFAAARKESPSEETRQRIVAALRMPPQPKDTWFSKFIENRQRLSWAAAAASLSALAMLLFQSLQATPEIAAESLSRGSPRTSAEKEASPEEVANQTSSDRAPSAPEVRLRTAQTPAPTEAEQPPPPRAPPSLKQELLGMQRARAALDGGDAASALRQLDSFSESPGWEQLRVEANLLRIEALAQLGRTDEAQIQARRFVEQNPNNPLVDRAAQFTQVGSSSHSSSAHDASESIKSEGE